MGASQKNISVRPDVSIVAKSGNGYHVAELIKELTKRGLGVKIIDFDRAADFSEEMKKLGRVTLWRASSLQKSVQRSSVANYLEKTYMVNEAVFLRPGTSEKFYQQQTIASEKSLARYSIPTYNVLTLEQFGSLLQKKLLSFPVIAKPYDGSRGVGIELLHSVDDLQRLALPLKNYVLQNFIANDGDWRVIVIGGRPIGVMKRVARDGSYLNNISRGARAYNETDEDVLSVIFDIAPKVAGLFNLRVCGVDIIRDATTGEYKILEVNTAPQWGGEFGFQATTGVNVAAEIAQYVESVLARLDGELSPAQLVDQYHKQMISTYPVKAFHYASRLWLWTGDAWARQVLDREQESYVGMTASATRQLLRSIFDKKDKPLTADQIRPYRKKYLEKYRMLPVYNALLFKVIFSDSVYNKDIRPYVAELVSDKEFITLFRDLSLDHDAIRVLSTLAVNFFYTLKNYFNTSLKLSSMVLVDPYEIIKISKGYQALVECGELSHKDALKLRVYLLTHAILGESRFYQRTVRMAAFRDICRELEAIIQEHYFDVSLDNKCEFLVCSRLCGYRPAIKNLILDEAKRSLSWSGQFIVDNDASGVRHILRTSEHRSVLFVMASQERTPPEVASRTSGVIKDNKPKQMIGRLVRVELPDFHGIRLVARVDTGATRSSIAASSMKEEDGKVSFVLFDPDHPLYDGRTFVFPLSKVVEVKNPEKTDGGAPRYVVPIKFKVGGNEKIVECSVVERHHMLYPVLLGRDFLFGEYIVDVSQQFISDTVKLSL